jgi:glycine/D-amino acid oxidase-like deaminating enzyme
MGEDGKFRVTTSDRHDSIHDYRARKIVVATGYYDLANKIGVPVKTAKRYSTTTGNRIRISILTSW